MKAEKPFKNMNKNPLWFQRTSHLQIEVSP